MNRIVIIQTFFAATILLIGFLVPITTSASVLDDEFTPNNPCSNPFRPMTEGVPDFCPITPLGGTPFEQWFEGDTTLVDFFNSLFRLAISIGALLAVLQLAYGGWIYMTSTSGGQKDDAKKRIWGAIIGLLMLLATVLILRQINPDIVSLNILPGEGGQGTAQQQSRPQVFDSGQRSDSPILDTYCADTAPDHGGGNTSGPNRYHCFPDWGSCSHAYGNASCAAYGFVDDPGQGALPSDIDDYITRWVSGDTAVNRCVTIEPGVEGWKSINGAYCGAAQLSTGDGQCCAIRKDWRPTLQQDDGGGFIYTAALERFIRVGQWCSTTANGGYRCHEDRGSCQAGINGTSCRARTQDGAWSLVGPRLGETTYDLSNGITHSGIPSGSYCYRTPTTAYCTGSSEQLCSENLESFRIENPGVSITGNQCAQINL